MASTKDTSVSNIKIIIFKICIDQKHARTGIKISPFSLLRLAFQLCTFPTKKKEEKRGNRVDCQRSKEKNNNKKHTQEIKENAF